MNKVNRIENMVNNIQIDLTFSLKLLSYFISNFEEKFTKYLYKKYFVNVPWNVQTRYYIYLESEIYLIIICNFFVPGHFIYCSVIYFLE